jgi:Amt family ammonium transporter
MLKNIELTALMGSFYQYIHVAFQGSFACITVGLIVGALAERIRFSAVLIFVVVWMTLSYVPIAHMVWGGGLLATHGALDFAGGTVVHINAAVAGLVGAYLIGKRVGFGKEAFKPHNLPMVFTGTAILYFGWFGFNAGSASAANEIAALAFVNTVVATAVLSSPGSLASGRCAVNLLCWAPVQVRLPVWLVSRLRVVMSVSAARCLSVWLRVWRVCGA